MKGSESPGSDRSEGKRNVDSDPVEIVDNSSSNKVMSTERNQDSCTVLSIQNCYNALYLPVSDQQGNIYKNNKDGERNCEILRNAKEPSDGEDQEQAVDNPVETSNLKETIKQVSQVNPTANDDNFSNVLTCKYVNINDQLDCWGEEDISSESSHYSSDSDFACIVDLFSPAQISEKAENAPIDVEAVSQVGSPCNYRDPRFSPKDQNSQADIRDKVFVGRNRSLWGNSKANTPEPRDGKRGRQESADTPLSPAPQRSMQEPKFNGTEEQRGQIRALAFTIEKRWEQLTDLEKEALEGMAKFCPDLPDLCNQPEARSRRLLKDCQRLFVKLRQWEIQVEHEENVRRLHDIENRFCSSYDEMVKEVIRPVKLGDEVTVFSASSEKCPWSPITKGDIIITRNIVQYGGMGSERDSKGSSAIESGFQSEDRVKNAQLYRSRQPDLTQADENNRGFRTTCKSTFANSQPYLGKGQDQSNWTDDSILKERSSPVQFNRQGHVKDEINDDFGEENPFQNDHRYIELIACPASVDDGAGGSDTGASKIQFRAEGVSTRRMTMNASQSPQPLSQLKQGGQNQINQDSSRPITESNKGPDSPVVDSAEDSDEDSDDDDDNADDIPALIQKVPPQVAGERVSAMTNDGLLESIWEGHDVMIRTVFFDEVARHFRSKEPVYQYVGHGPLDVEFMKPFAMQHIFEALVAALGKTHDELGTPGDIKDAHIQMLKARSYEDRSKDIDDIFKRYPCPPGIALRTWSAQSELITPTRKPTTPYDYNEYASYVMSIPKERRTPEQKEWLSKFKWTTTKGFRGKRGKVYVISTLSLLCWLCGGMTVDGQFIPYPFNNGTIIGAKLRGPSDSKCVDNQKGEACRKFVAQWFKTIAKPTDPDHQDLLDLLKEVKENRLSLIDIEENLVSVFEGVKEDESDDDDTPAHATKPGQCKLDIGHNKGYDSRQLMMMERDELARRIEQIDKRISREVIEESASLGNREYGHGQSSSSSSASSTSVNSSMFP